MVRKGWICGFAFSVKLFSAVSTTALQKIAIRHEKKWSPIPVLHPVAILLLYLPHARTSSDPYVPVQKTDTSLSCGIYGYKTTCWHLFSPH